MICGGDILWVYVVGICVGYHVYVVGICVGYNYDMWWRYSLGICGGDMCWIACLCGGDMHWIKQIYILGYPTTHTSASFWPMHRHRTDIYPRVS